jgi:dTDP-4-dehydrorhamnose reductase
MGEVVALDFPQIDFTRADSLRQSVRDNRPDVIINAAAYTAVDKAETETALARAINAEAPSVLAEEARRAKAWLVHYSTDYVFDGTQERPYSETDAPQPLGAYGRTKLEGDQAIQSAQAKHLIFRLCWVYGTRGQNFLLTIQRLARERESLRVVADQFGCPTWSRLIAEATAHALRQTLTAADPHSLVGTYHLASSTHTTWHGFAEAIVQLLPPPQRKCVRVDPIATHENPTPARPPARSVLDCGKLERVFGLRLPGWHESLHLALDLEPAATRVIRPWST